MMLYAKSKPLVLLKDHLLHVATLCRALAAGFEQDQDLAYQAGLLHDIGKAHPAFQARIHHALSAKGNRQFEWKGIWRAWPFRHEIASLFFLPLFNPKDWDALVEMVVGHHKAIDAPRRKGLLGLLAEEDEEAILHHYLQDFESWKQPALDVLADLGVVIPPIFSERDARSGLTHAISLCKKWSGERRLSELRGLMMAADHMASALEQGTTGFSVPALFGTPDLTSFERRSENFPLSLRDADSPKAHTLVVAPTGAGKTDYLMRRCKGRVFYTLPFQASIDAMYNRFAKGDSEREIPPMIPEGDDIRIHRLHGASKLRSDDDNNELDTLLQPFAGASVKVLTPYQLAAVALAAPGFEALALDLKGQDVILDEIHTYQDVGQALVHGLVRGLVQLGCRVHIGTATVPTKLYEALLHLLGGAAHTLEVKFTPEELETYTRHRIYQHLADTDVTALVREVFQANPAAKVLLVANTVAQAQLWAQQLRACPDLEHLDNKEQFVLLHSRFKRKDRNEREQRLQKVLELGKLPCICVSTQVVEVSLDISFDIIITQVSPIDSLVQRLGRVNRRRERQDGLADVHILGVSKQCLPYKRDILEATLAALPERGRALEAPELQKMIDQVYPEFNPTRIEANLAWNAEGVFMKKALCNGSVNLMELLEIDTVAALLQSDIGPYLDAEDFMARRMLEIPVPGSTRFRGLPTLEGVNDKIYLVDQSPEDYEHYGLRLNNTIDTQDTNIL